MPRQHIFNLKFSLKSLQANCHRSSCKVHAHLKIQNEERKFREVADMKKNIALFNSDLDWELVGVEFDQVTGLYGTKNAVISIMYETQQMGSRTNKLKVGHVTIDLGKILNDKTYRIHNYYSLQKCYDQAAKIKLSIDFLKIQEAAIRGGGQKLGQDQYTRLKQAMQWRTSKMKERILDEQKNLLQTKLYEYEDKLQKYRDTNNEQVKRLTEQLERKQEKISLLSQQNNSLTTAVQSLQVTVQKHKSTIAMLQQDLFQTREKSRSVETNKDNLSHEITNLQNQLYETKYKLDQVEKAKEKKEQYFKGELEKYNKKYLETENARNKIVFEMQNKLKEELEHKDTYYKQLIEKLQAKFTSQTNSSKQTSIKTTKEVVIIKQTLQRSQKEKKQLSLEIQELSANKQFLLNIKKQMQDKIEQLENKLKAAHSQNEISEFSNNNLQKQLSKIKADKKILAKNNDDLKYEIELANRTIEENEQTIVKLHRELKTHKEREFYMEEKYQDELEIKTYNEECMRGTNSHYRNQVKRLTTKLKIIEERLEQAEDKAASITKEKDKLHEEAKRHLNLQFEASQREIKFENEVRSLKSSLQESQHTCHSLEMQLLQVQKSYESLLAQHNSLETQMQRNAEVSDDKIRTLQQKLEQTKQEYEFALLSDVEAKNVSLNALEIEMKKVKENNKHLQYLLNQQGLKLQQSEFSSRNLTQKIRNYERQIAKFKIQANQNKEEIERLMNEINKNKKEITNLRDQLVRKSGQYDSLQKKIRRVKDGYVELINWTLERITAVSIQSKIANTAVLSTTREYIQSIEGEVDMEIVHHVNNHLEKIYNEWNRLQKLLFEHTEERDRLSEQITKIKYEQQYSPINTRNLDISLEDDTKFEQQLQALTMKFNTKINNSNINRNDSEAIFKESLKIEEMRRQNRQLQNQITQKSYDLQIAKQEVESQRRTSSSLKDQLRELEDEIDELKSSLSKKNMQLNNLQFQGNDKFDEFSYGYQARSPTRYRQDFKTDIQSKYRQKKALEESEAKCQQLLRQNNLQKAKIDLLQSKTRTSQENFTALETNFRNLQQSMNSIQTDRKKWQKSSEQQKENMESITNQLQLMNAKYLKKQKELEQEHKQVLKLQKTIDISTQKAQQAQNKHFQEIKKLQNQISNLKANIQKLEEEISQLRIKNQGLTLELSSLQETTQNQKKEWDNKLISIQASLNRTKKNEQEIYAKFIALSTQKSELEEKMKDIEMDKNINMETLRKQIVEANEKLEAKDYELEELRFTSESQIIQLQRQIQELTGRA